MKKDIELDLLFDYYGILLSEKKQTYFKHYYFDNLSLMEISEIMNVSRNAVHKQLKSIEIDLNNYNDKLRLIERDKALKDIMNEVDDVCLKRKIEELMLNY
jgi:predicted DNA-binding protein YlxM (UPF0122 family)